MSKGALTCLQDLSMSQARAMRLKRRRKEVSSHAFGEGRVVGQPSLLPIQVSVNAKTSAAAIVRDGARAKTERRHKHGSCALKCANGRRRGIE